MRDLDRLKFTAEAVVNGGTGYYSLGDAYRAFLAECTPELILALCRELQESYARIDAYRERGSKLT